MQSATPVSRFKCLITAVLTGALSSAAITITSGPYLQNVTDSEATIIWRTDLPSTGWVETAPDDSTHFYSTERKRTYATQLGSAQIGTLHRVTLRNLQPGTTYRYRVASEEVVDRQPYHVTYGGVTATEVHRQKPLKFSTLQPGSDHLDFRMVNDIHGSGELLSDLLAGTDFTAEDLMIFNGDMVSYMDNEDGLFNGFINKAVELFAAETPFYMSRGNHETRGNYSQEYMRYFPTTTGMPYYTFTAGPVFFIVLDSGEDKPDSDIEYSRTSFFDDYRTEEARWLEKVIESPEFKNAPFRIVINHVPPVNSLWHGTLHFKELFLPLLNKAGIDLMLCGHLHKAVYNAPGTDGAQFPIIVNSNKESLDISADAGKGIELRIVGLDGKTRESHSYTPRKR